MIESDQPLRIFVIGLSDYLARRAFPGLERAAGCELVGVAVRDVERAREKLRGASAGELIQPYDAVFDRSDVDAVYITLPNALHIEWTLRAIEAGKHVLCEKPMALRAEDVDRIDRAARARRVTVQEGYMYRFHPQWTRVTEILGGGLIGDVCAVISNYAYLDANYAGPRFQPELGGGVMRMVGCYPMSVALLAFDVDPVAVTALARPADTTGVDGSTSAVMEFSGGHATITATVDGYDNQYVRIVGTTGVIEVAMPFNPAADASTVTVLHRDEGVERIEIEPADQFQLQFEHFARVARGVDQPIVPLAESRRCARALAAITDSAGRGGVRIEL